MGSNQSETISVVLKKTLHLKAKKVETSSLKALSRILKMTQRLTLTRKYGKISRLLEVDVQEEAITALAQYYDPPLRCFTFQDFQLAPTIEEFEQILGLSLEEKTPYHYLGHYTSLETIASIFKVQARDLHGVQQNRNGTKGFSKEYLEAHLHHLAQLEDWDAFIDVLALTIYGLVLFPNIEGHVDYAAIDVFLACKFNSDNPVPAVLADVYCTMNFCHEKNGKRILCCLPVLYVWLTAHIFSRSYQTNCPIVDFKMCQLKIMQSHEWANHFAKLDEEQIRWYPRWKEVETLIYQCGNFPNVPLMVTRGCINYNPCLAQRQLGYSIMGPPSESLVTPFVFYYMEEDCNKSLEKVRNAWRKVVRKGKELGVRSCGVKESYRQWVKDKVLEVKLPFRTLMKAKTIGLTFTSGEDEEMKEMKTKLTKFAEDKKKVEIELIETRQACATLKRENTERDNNLEGASKSLKSEQESMTKTKQCLRATNKELRLRRQERDKALVENQQLKELLVKAKIAQRDALKQVDEMKQQMEGAVIKYGETIRRERQYMEEEITKHQAIMRQEQRKVQELEEHTKEQEEITIRWMERFSDLVRLAKTAIADVPWHLKRAETMVNPLDTLAEIRDCIEYCKDLIRKIKHLLLRGLGMMCLKVIIDRLAREVC